MTAVTFSTLADGSLTEPKVCERANKQTNKQKKEHLSLHFLQMHPTLILTFKGRQQFQAWCTFVYIVQKSNKGGQKNSKEKKSK